MEKGEESNLSKNHSNNSTDITKGISTAIALLLGTIFLYVNPNFFGSQLVSYTIGALLGFIGIIGFMIEISKMNNKLSPLFKELASILIIGTLIVILYYIFSNLFVNIIVFILFLTCVYALSNLVINFSILISLEKEAFKKVLTKIPIIVLNSLIFVLTVMQILQIIDILE